MSKSNKKDVGKGIRALLANIDKTEKQAASTGAKVKLTKVADNLISTSSIEANPFQPRSHFDEEAFSELVQSIKIHGIVQPIAVRKLNASSYQIISGERRWRAAKQLKLKKVPVHILEADDQAMLEIALLENVQRSDLNPMEIALSYQRLIDECKLTHEELSERLGKKRTSISNYLRLLKLSPSVQESVQNKKISLGHAKVLAGVSRSEDQTFLLGEILKGDLSVRALELLIKSRNATRKKPLSSTEVNPEVKKIKRRLQELTGCKVSINRSDEGKGFIKFPFRSDGEFNDIIDAIFDQ